MPREEFARRILALAGEAEKNTRLLEAFRDTPRERFLPPGTPEALVNADTTVRLGIDDLNNGQPSLHAACIAALRPVPGETVVHVGAGTGYYTAILARMVGERGRVEAYELQPELAVQAREKLAALAQVRVHQTSGAGTSLPACDVLYVNCGATGPQPVWREALRPGGRLLFPLTGADQAGAMLLTQRPHVPSNTWAARFLLPVAFIGCQGMREREEEAAVTRALERGGLREVCWLRLGEEAGGQGWCVGKGWRLTRDLR